VGSRTIKLVVLDSESDRIMSYGRVETTFNPLDQCRRVLYGKPLDKLIATGYGRKLAQDNFGAETITEILAHALGARLLFPACNSILDIGGQDTKAIALDNGGRVRKFEMNDRCAAGTGKFLEFMATSFQVPIEDFGEFALQGKPGLTINSMCTVFAETEATSLMARGHSPHDIALALHVSVVKRSLSMLRRVSTNGSLVFSGGVARNRCVVELIEKEISCKLMVSKQPDMAGALGAALHGARN
jgi:predicted CoA-substrate-specific enzyme activase